MKSENDIIDIIDAKIGLRFIDLFIACFIVGKSAGMQCSWWWMAVGVVMIFPFRSVSNMWSKP